MESNRGVERRSRGIVVLAFGLSMALALGPIQALPSETDSWIRISSPNFVYLSNAGEAPTRDIARNLESLRAVLGKVTHGLELGRGRPTVVYVFKDAKSFAPYKGATAADPRELMSGYFQRGTESDLIALDASALSYGVIYHEYLHEVLEHSFDRLPLWFEEGTADLYASFECDKDDARIGRPVREYLDWLDQKPPMPLKDLLTVTHESKEYNEDRRRGAFYATSWLVVHYLMLGNAARKPQLASFLAAVENTPPDLAFAAAFGTDYAGMEKELRTYLKDGVYTYTRWTATDLKIPEATSSRPMPRAEVLGQLGSLLARIEDPDSHAAQMHLKAALELDAGEPYALAGLATMAIRGNRLAEASQLYAKALERLPQDADLLFLAGRTLVAQDVGPSQGNLVRLTEPSPVVLRAREMLARSLKIVPDDPEAQVAYGVTWLGDRGDVSPGIVAMEAALKHLPRRVDVVVGLLQLYIQVHDRKKAETLVNERLTVVGGAEDMKHAREMLLSLDLDEARSLVESHEYETALPILRKVQGVTTIPERKAWLDGIIPEIEAAAEWSRENAIYEEAVRLVRKGDLSGAAAKLAALVKWCKDPRVCPSAKKSLAELMNAGAKR